MGLFEKIKQGLQKTRGGILSQIDNMLSAFTKIDDELFEELEEMLISADIGAVTSAKICENLKQRVKKERVEEPDKVYELLKKTVSEMLGGENSVKLDTKPSIVLVIGVNGVGKTTTIGKLANLYKLNGKKVLLSAADTFRAGAIEQLKIWANRCDVDIIHQEEGSDPAAVVFDSINAAKKRESDIIICDTAGRLHNKKHLMDELAKINRIIDRELPCVDKEILLVIDATTGQNAINQAREFKNTTGLTGIAITKLDGTAKGGMVISIKEELGVPVKYVGIGEKIDDLLEFDPDFYTNALFMES